MYKSIIFSNNLNFVKKFSNILFKNFRNVHIISIVGDANELPNLFNSSIINTLFISYEDYKNSSLKPYLNNFRYKIIVCDTPCNEKSSKYTLFLKNTDNESILKDLNKFILKTSEKYINKKFRKIFNKLNFDFKLIGTHYLLDSCVYAYLTKDSYNFENLEKNIYPHVAKKYNTSVTSVKWSIIRTINNAKSNYNKSNFKAFYIDISDKFTAKTIITILITCL